MLLTNVATDYRCGTNKTPLRTAVAIFVHLFQQTYEEMLAELEEADAEAAPEEEEEEEEYVYNPLKLPLGWDGKPIPYWLYKLHGLNQEFKCEICGNYR